MTSHRWVTVPACDSQRRYYQSTKRNRLTHSNALPAILKENQVRTESISLLFKKNLNSEMSQFTSQQRTLKVKLLKKTNKSSQPRLIMQNDVTVGQHEPITSDRSPVKPDFPIDWHNQDMNILIFSSFPLETNDNHCNNGRDQRWPDTWDRNGTLQLF